MGFISFNERYYGQKLNELESGSLAADGVYEARQLLKVLDDLRDEGYTNLNDVMERDFSCLTRLRKLISAAGAAPFPTGRYGLPEAVYTGAEYELTALTEKIIADAAASPACADNPFLDDVFDYSEWIGYDENIAYVFLFRDALLPYSYFVGRKRGNVHAWLIGRRFVADRTGTADADDEIRLPIYEALESGQTDFKAFCGFCEPKMRKVLQKYGKLESALRELLSTVTEPRIVVVESGYCGTVPMMLKSLDDRVTFRMYTTAPFLYDTYRDLIFCRKYEDVRKFETPYSQDLLMRYSSYRDGRFYVQTAENPEIRSRAASELRYFLTG